MGCRNRLGRFLPAKVWHGPHFFSVGRVYDIDRGLLVRNPLAIDKTVLLEKVVINHPVSFSGL